MKKHAKEKKQLKNNDQEIEIKAIIIKDQSWWHIRKYYKSGHGALIVGESGPGNNDDYGFLNITKKPPTGYAYRETEKSISKNIEEKSYIRLYLQRGKKKRFSRWLLKYELTDKDYQIVLVFLKNKKRN